MPGNIKYLNYFYGNFHSPNFPVTSKSLKAKIFNFVLFPITCLILALMLYNFRFMHDDIFRLARNFQSVTSFVQIFTRHFIYAQHSFLLEKLLENLSLYWKYNSQNPKFLKMTTIRIFFVKSLKIMSFFLVTFIIILPLFSRGIDLPQACWVPGGSESARILIYFLESVCLLEPMILLDMVDSIFLLTGVELEIQFILLRRAIQAVKIHENSQNESLNKLKKYAAYHQFLLNEHAKLKKSLSMFFLLQYFITIEGLCVELFVIKQANSFEQILFSALYITVNSAFLSFAFLAASFLEIEAEALPQAIFEVDWYNASSNKIGKHILFMLMRAQKPLRLTGAGMFDVSRRALLQVYRLAFSISTLLKQM